MLLNNYYLGSNTLILLSLVIKIKNTKLNIPSTNLGEKTITCKNNINNSELFQNKMRRPLILNYTNQKFFEENHRNS